MSMRDCLHIWVFSLWVFPESNERPKSGDIGPDAYKESKCGTNLDIKPVI